MSRKDIYEFLHGLEKKGVVQMYYEIRCSQCQKPLGIVRVFNEIPETVICENCDTEISSIENTFPIYKVIKDD